MSRSKFDEEFKIQVVREVIDRSRPIVEVAKSYGLVPQTVGNWVAKYRREHPEPGMENASSEESAEIQRLKKELRESRMEVEFLKKAAAFFAKESQ